MTLARAISYFVKLAVVIAGAVWLANRPGALTIHWFDYRIDMPVGLAIGLVILAFIVVFVLWRVWRVTLAAPREYSIYRANHRRAKGHRALTQGMIAIAAGDPAAARRHAKSAKDLLGEATLPLLLAAQAAQLAGEDESAERYFDALAKDGDTTLLGLRGLAALHLKRNDEKTALELCERALALAPQAPWAGETAHRLQLKLGRFEAAESSLKALARSGALDAKLAQRRRAALLTERARRILADETAASDLDRAIAFSREAVKLAGDFAPARAALAQALMRIGKSREAARLIDQAWDDAPHWSLGRILLSALGDLAPLERAKRAEAVAARNPDHPASLRLAGEAAMSAKLWGDARKHLERLCDRERATGGLTQDLCRLMARLEMAERYNALSERQWLDQATSARPGAEWCCGTCGAVSSAGPETGGWQLLCPRCEAIDSLEWKSPEAQQWRDVSAPDPLEGNEHRPGAPSNQQSFMPERSATGEAMENREEPPIGASVNAARLVN